MTAVEKSQPQARTPDRRTLKRRKRKPWRLFGTNPGVGDHMRSDFSGSFKMTGINRLGLGEKDR